jgi:hypothetical protein
VFGLSIPLRPVFIEFLIKGVRHRCRPQSYLSRDISHSFTLHSYAFVFKLLDMASQTVVSKGIFHGLPTFPEYDGKKLSIIVTGANGISGSAMVKVLSEAPERWDKIYALSRRPATYPASSNIVSIAVDFLNSTPEAIAKVLRDHEVKA